MMCGPLSRCHTPIYILTKENKSAENNPKTSLFGSILCFTLTYCHMFKSKQYFGQKAKKKHFLGLFLPPLYIIYTVVCVFILLLASGSFHF